MGVPAAQHLQALRFQLTHGSLPAGSRPFLDLAADPRKQKHAGTGPSTLRCGRLCLLTRELSCAVRAVVTSHAFSAGLPARLGTGQTSTQAAVDVLPAHAADVVPINEGQRAAVEALRGGLNIIHGPPGTGKSTTIFHMIESRVQAAAHVSSRVGGGRCT